VKITRTIPRTVPIVCAILLLPAAGFLHADLKAALAERDLGKRSKLALDNAGEVLKAVRETYQKGDNQALRPLLQELEDSVGLAWDSLESTGKNPRNNPKWFKQAEIETRNLLKKLETLQHDMGFEERASLDPAKVRLQKVHDDLLLGLMEGKHR
jgi:hypothetical protein